MRALVTGGEGFIGSHLVRELRAAGHEVYSYDRKTGNDLLSTLVYPDADVIFHLAGSCSTPKSLGDPIGTFKDNVVAAVNVLDAARRAQTPVILTSSVKARHAASGEGRTPYGASKVMVETWATEYHRSYGVPLVINRPGTIYGPGQEGSAESGWIAWFLKARDEGLEVTINGDGRQVRDLLHVSDYVRLMMMQADDIARYNGQLYDVGGGVGNAVIVGHMAEQLGLKYHFGPARQGDADVFIGENKVPGWVPSIAWRESETFR